MYLAKGKNGQIGRAIPGQGMQTKIVPPSNGGYHRNLYLSEQQIAQDQAYFTAQSQQRKAQVLAQRQRDAQRRLQAQEKARLQGLGAIHRQRLAKIDPMREKLKAHFAKQMTMGQTAKVAATLYHSPAPYVSPNGAESGYYPKPRPPADASSSGANMHLVPGTETRGPVVWHSDYRQTLFKGNPLTRDGKYGPAVTDFDRFVRGNDVYNDPDRPNYPIAGNTMLGRYEGHSKAFYSGIAGFGDDTVAPASDYVPMTPDVVDVSTNDVTPATPMVEEPVTFEPIDPSVNANDPSLTPSFDTGNVAPTEEELQAEAAAAPASPSLWEKAYTAATIEASKDLPKLLQQQMLAAIKAGASVTQSGNTILIRQPGQPTRAIGRIAGLPAWTLPVAGGLAVAGVLLYFLKHRKAGVPA